MDFSNAIFKIQRQIQKIETEEMERFGLKGSFAQYLLVLAHQPAGLPASELCRICDKDKAAVSRALSEMGEKGLINRPVQSGYRLPYTLTEDGKNVANFLCARVSPVVEEAGKGLDKEQRPIVYEALGLIAENLERICKKNME
jgi:DNA-binding MarR family transcriptional regulator